MSTKSLGRKHILDKFYTKPDVALSCIQKISLQDYDLIIEPSAGSGSFSNQIKDCVAYDLHPESNDIIEQDWFDYSRDRDSSRVLVIGNPPFGQQNNLAVNFINHAAQFASTVAFILPMSFRKASVQRRIHTNLHLVADYDLPKHAFLLEGNDYGVPCVFQVWEWREEPREIVKPVTTSTHFTFVKKQDNPDFRVQRVGGNAGKASVNTNVSEASNYFLKVTDTTQDIEALVERVNGTVFPTRDLGVGPRTISKGELIVELEKLFN